MNFLVLGGILLAVVLLFYGIKEMIKKQAGEEFIQERKDRDGERD